MKSDCLFLVQKFYLPLEQSLGFRSVQEQRVCILCKLCSLQQLHNKLMPDADLFASDDWLAKDKAQHFAACFLVTIIGYALASNYIKLRPYRLVSGACFGVIVGVGKELGDFLQIWKGAVSLKDLAADAVGTVIALASAVLYEQYRASRPENRRSERQSAV